MLTSSARFLFPAGLWLYLAGSSLPCLTLIGSPNFGYRSVHRDLEAQIAIVTENQALQQQLHQVGGGKRGRGRRIGCSALPVSHSLAAVSRAAHLSPVRKSPSPQQPPGGGRHGWWPEQLAAGPPSEACGPLTAEPFLECRSTMEGRPPGQKG